MLRAAGSRTRAARRSARTASSIPSRPGPRTAACSGSAPRSPGPRPRSAGRRAPAGARPGPRPRPLRPSEMPPRIPSSRAIRRAMFIASSLPTVMISSITAVSRTSGTNPAPMPWIGWGPFGPPDSTGRRGRLDRDHPHRRFALLDDLGDSRDGAAGADRGDKDIDLAIRVAPNFFRGGAAMDFWIRGIAELLRSPCVGRGGGEFFRAADRAFHAVLGRREHEVRAERGSKCGAPHSCCPAW